jgi:hypothetical protein
MLLIGASEVNNKNRVTPIEVIQAYQQALVKYREECSLYARIRNQYPPDYPEATLEELGIYHRALRRYRQACKDFRAARSTFLIKLRAHSAASTVVTEYGSDEEYLELYEKADFKSTLDLSAQTRIAQSVDKDNFAAIAEAAAQFKAQQATEGGTQAEGKKDSQNGL